MLTKIFSLIVAILLVVIIWMGISHQSEVDALAAETEKAVGELAEANEAKGAAITRARTAEGVNKSNLGMLATLSADLQLQKEVTRQMQERAEAIQSNYDQLNSQYQEALQNDSTTRDWASAPLPESVASGRLLYRATPATAAADGGGDKAGGGAPAGAAPVPSTGLQAPGQR